MSMSIKVGVAPVEPGSSVERDLVAINEFLIGNGHRAHREPDVVPDDAQWLSEELPYTFFDRLQRLQAWVNQGRGLPDPLDDGGRARFDPAIGEEYDQLASHLVLHNPAGYFVPVDFAEPLIVESVTGKMIGSSRRLLSELTDSAVVLGIELDSGLLTPAAIELVGQEVAMNAPYGKEKLTWFAMYDAARRSVAHDAVIVHG
jgi:hypothetical protein